jgi:membrane protein DedA with SNARE-associated domain
MLWLGYFLGESPLANRLDKLIVLVVFVSLLPLIIGTLRGWLKNRSTRSVA